MCFWLQSPGGPRGWALRPAWLVAGAGSQLGAGAPCWSSLWPFHTAWLLKRRDKEPGATLIHSGFSVTTNLHSSHKRNPFTLSHCGTDLKCSVSPPDQVQMQVGVLGWCSEGCPTKSVNCDDNTCCIKTATLAIHSLSQVFRLSGLSRLVLLLPWCWLRPCPPEAGTERPSLTLLLVGAGCRPGAPLASGQSPLILH